ncbi:DUF1127 domain-containing protein [Vibrio albus]|jgi:uncharacterized protein YjiS (DUF1127 family)|uniref:DUF1127 domain-containing protein n=1 Tax=Vibrio albus TaxID=2200953 RepID=A0A2U3B5M1_9VIBR|nr:DUF1127 domain-containing protein [Vibrio albus]PWI32098.1 DUF1127 domain-containing protein [Vibrio albus]
MKQSFYIQLAIFFVKADLRREERQWQRKVRRSAYDIPWHSEHLLRDIGLDREGRATSASNAAIAEHRVHHYRRIISSRPVT